MVVLSYYVIFFELQLIAAFTELVVCFCHFLVRLVLFLNPLLVSCNRVSKAKNVVLKEDFLHISDQKVLQSFPVKHATLQLLRILAHCSDKLPLLNKPADLKIG